MRACGASQPGSDYPSGSAGGGRARRCPRNRHAARLFSAIQDQVRQGNSTKSRFYYMGTGQFAAMRERLIRSQAGQMNNPPLRTEHKQAVEARRLMQEQLHQSEKMESVGQLTGGIAHDFNNLIMVVSANLELIEEATDNGRVRQFAAAARRATDWGAKLTAQLLAFSRQQRLSPKLVDANELISEFQGLIRQAVGGACEVKLLTDRPLWLCHVDPPLLEPALLNLALNGRDAMPNGGLLTIETQNVVLDEGAVPGCLPGSYVKVSVTDTGCGMPPEVRDRVFEPFFTPRRSARVPGSASAWSTALSDNPGGMLPVKAHPAREPRLLCTYLKPRKSLMPRQRRPKRRPYRQARSESWWSRTMRISCKSRRQC